ncbi:hypothetical protein AB0K34_37210 [Actinomadura sp. NPDC049382]|uniref:hypothetical protein n=1 Tax=Actinomadura sp. NPDC049382 TaxID=3158220 RepID=UPI00343B5185
MIPLDTYAFLLNDEHAPGAAAETIAAAITAMPERAPLAATLHRLHQKPGTPGSTWLVILRLPATVQPGTALRLRVEKAANTALGRETTTTELPPGTALHDAAAAALDVYDTERGWITPTPQH